MSDGRWLVLGAAGALAAGTVARRASANVEGDIARQPVEAPLEKGFTRNGFPWPMRTVAFHASAFVPEILREGFRTREMGAVEMVGGRWTRSTSLTLSLPRAAAIALGLETLVLGARRAMGCVELLDRLVRETPRAVREGTRGWELAGFPREPDLSFLRRTLGYLDAGWTFLYAQTDWLEEEGRHRIRSVPSRALRVGPWHLLMPPDTRLPPVGKYGDRLDDRGSFTDAPKAFYELYRAAQQYCGTPRECFHPIWYGNPMPALARRPPGDVGVLATRVEIPRVCTDHRGALRLGYLYHDELGERQHTWYTGKLDEIEHGCVGALEARDEYDRARGAAPMDVGGRTWTGGSTWDPRFGPWVARQQGRRGRADTMLYADREEELIVYATERIRVVGRMTMPDLRLRFGLGNRVTFPWFDDDDVDVRVVRRPDPDPKLATVPRLWHRRRARAS